MYKQVICLILGYASITLVAITTFWPRWTIKSVDSASVLGPIGAWKGLWADCVQIENGQYYCEEHETLLVADGEFR